MTSPAIKSNEKSRKALRKSSSSNGSQDTSGAASNGGGTATSTAVLPEEYSTVGLFSWLRVFRFANLLMRQGC